METKNENEEKQELRKDDGQGSPELTNEERANSDDSRRDDSAEIQDPNSPELVEARGYEVTPDNKRIYRRTVNIPSVGKATAYAATALADFDPSERNVQLAEDYIYIDDEYKRFGYL